MGPKPRPRPEQWSLDKAKRDGAKQDSFDQAPPKLPQPKERRPDGKFVGKEKVK